jgi:type II secretory pathway pseudopilin PulG
MSLLSSSKPGSADGFTLIELIIALGIGTLLIGAIGTAFAIGLRTTEETSNQVGEAAGAQIVGTWFLTDVQSAEQIGGARCGVSPSDVAEVFTRSTAADPPQERYVVWWLDAAGTGGNASYDLHRTECGAGPNQAAVITKGIQDLRIDCEASPGEIAPSEALQCTLAWTTTPGVPASSWPYRVTAVRRTG